MINHKQIILKSINLSTIKVIICYQSLTLYLIFNMKTQVYHIIFYENLINIIAPYRYNLQQNFHYFCLVDYDVEFYFATVNLVIVLE